MTDKPGELTGKKVLVTGGAGFIGSNIVDRISPDNDVRILDNLSTGRLTNLEKSKGRYTLIEGDIRDPETVKKAVRGVDYIFHLAAHVGNIRSINDPVLDMEVNIGGMINLMEACRDTDVKRIVYSSSAAIFGEAKYTPIDEDHPLYPESPYAVSKMAAEKYAFSYYKVHKIPTVSIRYFNAYGPRQDTSVYANAVSIFLGRASRGEGITIYGDGEQTRDFIYVADIVRANLLAATHPDAAGQVFNTASGDVYSINQLVALIKEISGRDFPVTYEEARAGEVRDSKANMDKTRKILGFETKTSFRDGLAETWKSLTR